MDMEWDGNGVDFFYYLLCAWTGLNCLLLLLLLAERDILCVVILHILLYYWLYCLSQYSFLFLGVCELSEWSFGIVAENRRTLTCWGCLGGVLDDGLERRGRFSMRGLIKVSTPIRCRLDSTWGWCCDVCRQATQTSLLPPLTKSSPSQALKPSPFHPIPFSASYPPT